MQEEEKKTSPEQGTEEARAGEAQDTVTKETDEVKAAEHVEASQKEDASDAEASEAAESGDQKTESKVRDLQKEKYEKEIAECKEKYLRLYAEFDNFRKRSEKEKSQMFDMGARDIIEKILPIVDNFERALGTVEKEDEDDAFTKGVRGIYKQIRKMFDDLDVKPIEAEGAKFDPNLHNAVMTDTESDAEEDTITQDLQKGYTYKGQVVRHSMVKVKK